MRRRAFVRNVAGLAAIAMLSGCAGPVPTTPTEKVRRIGYLTQGASAQMQTDSEPFRQALRDLGYVEGRDIVIELRAAESATDRLPRLVSELVSLPVDIVVTQGTTPTLAAQRTTRTVPIVFIRVTDPVGQGIVATLARPGGNITGTAGARLGPKQLEHLKAAIPGLTRVAVLWFADNPGIGLQVRDTEDGARTLGLDLQPFGVHNADELDIVLESIARSRFDALLVVGALNVVRSFGQIPDFAAKIRLPQMYSTNPAFVRAGGLMFLSENFPSAARSSAQLVDKILKGADPANLPVELPTQLDFIVNLAAAERIGLTIPESVLRQATEVVR
jgi:putative ABC transport system substrate-binding protein